ncbi:SIMPL domain-containing protein [Alkalihalobacillus oceani]|uniref:SIMPL domain-containing protein n=1 Tax=Halalkalibacter oceani TaxID=1653776 RepID=A0A9X2DPT5_9BACI|nr:SIMPL domain-containing protein [Halalkalibacter oceani]MCM3713910.1 SIMPL domain-containing protein [Halalkalibacter oceani]
MIDPANREKELPQISVIGEAELTVVPDQAVVTLGVTTETLELRQGQSENSAAMTAILDEVRRLGIGEDQIETALYQIDSRYHYEDGVSTFAGYEITHLFQITIEEINMVGTIVDAAVEKGANTVRTIQFTLQRADIYRQQALQLAVENGISSAQAIATTLGILLPPYPSKVEQQPTSPDFPSPRLLSASAATPIQPGQLTIRAHVLVAYE